MTTENIGIIASIVIGIVLLVFALVGYKKGVLRILFTTFSLLVALVLSAILTTPVANWLSDTSIGASVEGRVYDYVEESFFGSDDDESASDAATDADEETAASEGSNDAAAADEADAETLEDVDYTDSAVQSEVIESLPLPAFIKESLSENNTAEGYVEAGVNNFVDYIVTHLTELIIKAIAFVILAVVISLLLRVIWMVVKVIGRIPILSGFNRILGALVGIAEAMFIIWIICVIIMIFAGTSFGAGVAKVIDSNSFLSFIYNHNLLLTGLKSIFSI